MGRAGPREARADAPLRGAPRPHDAAARVRVEPRPATRPLRGADADPGGRRRRPADRATSAPSWPPSPRRSPLSADEVEAIARSARTRGCMTLKGASPDYDGEAAADRWELDDELLDGRRPLADRSTSATCAVRRRSPPTADEQETAMSIDVDAVKQGQKRMWAAGDYPDVARTIESVAEALVERRRRRRRRGAARRRDRQRQRGNRGRAPRCQGHRPRPHARAAGGRPSARRRRHPADQLRRG